MGFRSKIMTEDYSGLQVPAWFLAKYPQYHYSWNNYSPLLSIASRTERKFYGILSEEEVFTDLQKVLEENDYSGILSVVLLHECGGITLMRISKEKITAQEPTEWKEVTSVEHDYGCICTEITSLTMK